MEGGRPSSRQVSKPADNESQLSFFAAMSGVSQTGNHVTHGMVFAVFINAQDLGQIQFRSIPKLVLLRVTALEEPVQCSKSSDSNPNTSININNATTGQHKEHVAFLG